MPNQSFVNRRSIACSKCLCAEAVLLRSLLSIDEISEAIDCDKPVNASIFNDLITSCALVNWLSYNTFLNSSYKPHWESLKQTDLSVDSERC